MEKIIDGKTVSMFTLKNSNGMSADITNFGAKVVRLFAADRPYRDWETDRKSVV